MSSKDYETDEAEIARAEESGLIFLPYLMGERSPHNDVNAKGCFIGLNRHDDASADEQSGDGRRGFCIAGLFGSGERERRDAGLSPTFAAGARKAKRGGKSSLMC